MQTIQDALKAKVHADCEPVGVLAINISAVDQLQIDGLGRSPAQTDLRARLGYTANVLLPAGQPEHLANQCQRLHKIPLKTGAVCPVTHVGNCVIEPARIDVDAKILGCLDREGHIDVAADVLSGVQVPQRVSRKTDREALITERDDVDLGLGPGVR